MLRLFVILRSRLYKLSLLHTSSRRASRFTPYSFCRGPNHELRWFRMSELLAFKGWSGSSSKANSLASAPAPGQMSMIQSEHQHAKGLKQRFSPKTLETLQKWHPFLENAAARIHDRLVAHGSLAVFDSGSLPQPKALKDCAALPVYHLRSQLGGCKEVSRLRKPMGNHGVHQGTQLEAALAAWRSVHQAELRPLARPTRPQSNRKPQQQQHSLRRSLFKSSHIQSSLGESMYRFKSCRDAVQARR